MTARIIRDLPFDEYVRLPGEHATGLKHMLTSPRAYKHWSAQPVPDRDTLRVGRAAHSAILEPHVFAREYVTYTERRAGKKWDAFQSEHEDATILTVAQYERVMAMATEARTNPLVAMYLGEFAGEDELFAGEAELTITWTHARTGLACKSRLDWLCSIALVDLKTCRDPSPAVFATQAARLHYPMQMAFYAEAMHAAGIALRPVKILAIQNVPPFDSVLYEVPDEVLAVGVHEYDKALDMVASCRANDYWPGVANDTEQTLRLPAWAEPDWDEDMDDDRGWAVTVMAGE